MLTLSFFERVVKRETSYLRLFKNRNFLALFVGQAISSLGDWIIVIALVELIYRISGSGLAIGAYVMTKILPAIFLGSLAGVLIDRINRKWTMFFCDIFRGGLIVLLPFVRNLWQIYLITFFLETFSLFFVPAKDATIPNIVSDNDILLANSLFYTSNNLTMILGLSFGSTIILLVDRIWAHLPFFRRLTGPNAAFYIDATTFFISSIAISMLVLSEVNHKFKEVSFLTLKDDIFEGLRFLKENPLIRSMLLSLGIAILGAGSIYSLGVIYCNEVLKVKGGYGYLLAILGFGLTLGSLFSGFVGRFFSRLSLFTFSIFSFGVAIILFATFPYYEIALLASLIGGFSLAFLTVSGYTLLQEKVKDEVRGRVFASLESLLRVSLIISLGLTGALADIIGRHKIRFNHFIFHLNGAQTTIFLGGMVIVVASFVAFKKVREEKSFELKTKYPLV